MNEDDPSQAGPEVGIEAKGQSGTQLAMENLGKDGDTPNENAEDPIEAEPKPSILSRLRELLRSDRARALVEAAIIGGSTLLSEALTRRGENKAGESRAAAFAFTALGGLVGAYAQHRANRASRANNKGAA